MPQLTPRDHDALAAFQQSLGASESQFKQVSVGNPTQPTPIQPSLPTALLNNSSQMPVPFQIGNDNKMSPLAAANQLAFAASQMPALANADAASQFAAGFAAATALTQHQFRTMLDSMART
jgi:hypothetical protein